MRSIALDGSQSCLDLGLGEGSVAGEVEQALLLGVKLRQARCQRGVHCADAGLLVGKGLVEQAAN
ncbi:hypothetical protein [Nocardia salmonicida]|uniref:hypothetical protein n=1 Tax=Nocardia salmonicida TaxID=53431 RepID=UPI0007A3B46A|nr:hypothetical protein [Nocardia salmonicida]